MKNNTSILEQVNALTDEQKEKIPKIRKIVNIISLAVSIPIFLFDIYAILMFLDKNVSDARRETIWMLFCIATIVLFVMIGAVYAYVKIKFPYYNEKVYTYLKKSNTKH